MDKPKILIVDDDPDLRRGLNLRLRASHFETAYATDGFSAIAMAQKERPDLHPEREGTTRLRARADERDAITGGRDGIRPRPARIAGPDARVHHR